MLQSLIIYESYLFFLVVYGHIFVMGGGNKDFVGPLAEHFNQLPVELVFKLILASYVNLGEIGVAIFFMLSGFLIMRSRRNDDFLTFIKKRFIRIYPIAFIGTIISCLILILINELFLDVSFDVDLRFLQVVLVNGFLLGDVFSFRYSSTIFSSQYLMPVFWFLMVIVKFYLLVALASRWTANKILYLAGVLFLFILFVNMFGSALPDYAQFLLFGLAFAFHHIIYILAGCLCYFAFGEYVYGAERDLKNVLVCLSLKNILAFVFLAAVFVSSFLVCKQHIDKIPLPVDMIKNYSLSFVVFIVSLIIAPFFDRHVPSRLVTVLGRCSFSVYVTHFALGASFLYLLGLVGFPPLLAYSGAVILAFMFGWVVNEFIEIPIVKFLRSYLLRSD